VRRRIDRILNADRHGSERIKADLFCSSFRRKPESSSLLLSSFRRKPESILDPDRSGGKKVRRKIKMDSGLRRNDEPEDCSAPTLMCSIRVDLFFHPR
jgi:hypothetical protein